MVFLIIACVLFCLWALVAASSKNYNEDIQQQINKGEKLTIDFDKANESTKDLVQATNLNDYKNKFPGVGGFNLISEFEILLAGHIHTYFYSSGRRLIPGQRLILFHEENNPYDQYAVKVHNLFNERVGYIPMTESEVFSINLSEGDYYEIMVRSCFYDYYPDIKLKVKLYRDPKSNIQLRPMTRDESFRLSIRGHEIESHDPEAAINFFEKSINHPECPPGAYSRLVINYRKQKNYVDEIRVIRKWIDSGDNSNTAKKMKLNSRLEKALELSLRQERNPLS